MVARVAAPDDDGLQPSGKPSSLVCSTEALGRGEWKEETQMGKHRKGLSKRNTALAVELARCLSNLTVLLCLLLH